MSRYSGAHKCILLGTLMAVVCAVAACNVGRHPDDVDTELAGVFDPQSQEPPLKGLVDFSMEIEKVEGVTLSIAVAQGAFAKLGTFALPEEGTCEFFEEPWARYAVASLEAADVGPSITIKNDGLGGRSFDVPLFLAEPDFPDLITYRNPATNDEVELLLGGIALSGRFEPDASYTISAPGGPGMVSFEARGGLRTPEFFDITEPANLAGIRIDRSDPSDLRVEWGPVSEQSSLFLIRFIVIQGEGIAAQVVCNARDQDGSFVVPAEILALLPDGTVWCWGDNRQGSHGNGTTTNSSTPVQVSGISTATAIAVGYQLTCALLSDNTVKCWGQNNFGKLGIGSVINRATTPVPVAATPSAIDIVSGGSHTCAQLRSKRIKCWGSNSKGQLGDGTYDQRTEPISVSGISSAIDVETQSEHTCALLEDKTIKCWGRNSDGQLGNGSHQNSINSPVQASGISTATALAVGTSHTCALLEDKTVRCWGKNYYGQLGDGSTTDRRTPVQVLGLSQATAIAAASSHTCALLEDRTVKCWGGIVDGSVTPVQVSGISTATALVSGSYHTCVLLADKTIMCWGKNSNGQLGDGSNTRSSTPVPVFGATLATAIAAGFSNSCAIFEDKTVRCWGYNKYGQLGDGTTSDNTIPVLVKGL